jgi:CheY-like chemotaxis protein
MLYLVEIFKYVVDAVAFLQEGNVPDLFISDLNTPVMGRKQNNNSF